MLFFGVSVVNGFLLLLCLMLFVLFNINILIDRYETNVSKFRLQTTDDASNDCFCEICLLTS